MELTATKLWFQNFRGAAVASGPVREIVTSAPLSRSDVSAKITSNSYIPFPCPTHHFHPLFPLLQKRKLTR